MSENKFKQSFIYIAISLFVVVFIYLAMQFINLIKRPPNSINIREGRLTSFDEAIAYVIRDEELVDTSFVSGESKAIINDGNKVAKNGTIMSYVSSNDKEYENELVNIETSIQSIIENSTLSYSPEVKELENNVQNQIYELIKNPNEIYSVIEKKDKIVEKLQEKFAYVDTLLEDNDEIKGLIKERKNLLDKIEDSYDYIKSNKSAIVSYRVDGYESKFNIDDFAYLSKNFLDNIKIGVNQIVPIDMNNIKLIKNFYSYLAVVCNSKEAKRLNLNDIVNISFDNDLSKTDKASVEYIAEEGDSRIIVLKTSANSEYLTKYRKINLYLIWDNTNGLKIDDQAIKKVDIRLNKLYISEEDLDFCGDTYYQNESGDSFVVLDSVQIVTPTGYKKTAYVKVEKMSNGYAIISNYTDEELKDLGLSDSQIKDRVNVKVYDEIVLN